MRLFPRLFLGHLLVTLVALGALLLIAEVTAPSFYRHHVEQMVALLGPEGRELRPDPQPRAAGRPAFRGRLRGLRGLADLAAHRALGAAAWRRQP